MGSPTKAEFSFLEGRGECDSAPLVSRRQRDLLVFLNGSCCMCSFWYVVSRKSVKSVKFA